MKLIFLNFLFFMISIVHISYSQEIDYYYGKDDVKENMIAAAGAGAVLGMAGGPGAVAFGAAAIPAVLSPIFAIKYAMRPEEPELITITQVRKNPSVPFINLCAEFAQGNRPLLLMKAEDEECFSKSVILHEKDWYGISDNDARVVNKPDLGYRIDSFLPYQEFIRKLCHFKQMTAKTLALQEPALSNKEIVKEKLFDNPQLIASLQKLAVLSLVPSDDGSFEHALAFTLAVAARMHVEEMHRFIINKKKESFNQGYQGYLAGEETKEEIEKSHTKTDVWQKGAQRNWDEVKKIQELEKLRQSEELEKLAMEEEDLMAQIARDTETAKKLKIQADKLAQEKAQYSNHGKATKALLEKSQKYLN